MKKFLMIPGILIFCAGLGWGDSYTLQVSGNWDVPGNWFNNTTSSTAGTAPGPGDTADIPSSYTATLPGPVSIDEVAIDGTININSYTLTVTGTFTNSGTIRLEGTGSQFPSAKPAATAGTIVLTAASSYTELDSTGFYILELAGGSYHLDTAAVGSELKVSGGTHTSAASRSIPRLTVSGGMFTPGAANAVSGNVEVTAGTLDIGSNAVAASGTISQTGGTITTAGGTLTSTGGSVSQSATGTISGTELTVNAKTGITLGGNNDVPAVHLLNTQDSSQSGNISYKSAIGDVNTLQINAENGAAGGTVGITEQTGRISLGTGGLVSAGGSIDIITVNPAAGAGRITIGQAITSNNGGISITAGGSGGINMSVAPVVGSGAISLNGGGGNVTTMPLTTTNSSAAAIKITRAADVSLGNISASNGRLVLGTPSDPITGTIQIGAVSAGSLSGYGTNSVTLNGTIPDIAGYTLTALGSILDITTGGSIQITALINAATTKIEAGTTAGQGPGAIINGTTLEITAPGGINLPLNNEVTKFQGTTTNQPVVFKDNSGGLEITGIDAGTGDVNLSTAGLMSQSAVIKGAALIVSAPGGINLPLDNEVTKFQGTTTSQPVLFKDNSGDLEITGIDTGPAVQNVSITASGPVTQTAPVKAAALTLAGTSADFTLNTANNEVGTISASTVIAGLSFTNTNTAMLNVNSINAGAGITIGNRGATSGTAGNITVGGTGLATTTGTIILRAGINDSLTFGKPGTVTVAGSVSASFLVVEGQFANHTSGSVTAAVTVHADNYPTDLFANTTGTTTFIPRGNASLELNSTGTPTAAITDTPLIAIDADTLTGSSVPHIISTGGNIYVTDATVPDGQHLTLRNSAAGGFIEISGGGLTMTGTSILVLNPDSGGLRLNGGGIAIATSFSVTAPVIAGDGGNPNHNTSDAAGSIKAASIEITGTVNGTGGETNNLTLEAAGAVHVTGIVGGATRLGDIAVRNGAAGFDAAVNAKSYAQAAGSADFDGSQDYTEGFSFAGTNLTVNSSLRTDSDSTDDDGPFAFNGAAFILNGALTTGSGTGGGANTVTITNTGVFSTTAAGIISAGGKFSQIGTTGSVSIGANITTRNTADAADAAINFANAVTIAPGNNGTVILNSSAGNGDITLLEAVTSAGTNRSLILNSGTGTVTLSSTVNLSGSFTKSGSGDSRLHNNVTAETGISFNNNSTVNLNAANTALSTGTGAGNIAITGNITGTGGDIYFTSGSGNVTVNGTIGTSNSDRLGTIQLSSDGTANIFGDAAADTMYAASFTQTGTGTTTFNGPQNYSAGFSFAGNNLTVNNTLETDTNATGADGAILITNASSNVTFIVGPSGHIQPGVSGGGQGGLLTVNGHTNNSGTITAANIISGTTVLVNGVDYYKVIDFNGNYTSAATGTLNGALSSTAKQLLVFRGNAAFGVFTHEEDAVQFSTSTVLVTTHNVNRTGGGTVTMADVIIDTGNTVTVESGATIIQDPAVNLTLTGNAQLNTTDGIWYIGPPSTLPPTWYMLSNPSVSGTGDLNYVNPGPMFSGGFAGFNGTLTMENGSVLTTKDFYTQMTNSGVNKFTLNAPPTASTNCNISASGNVTINETFVNVVNSTLTMTGNGGKLAVRTHQSGVSTYPRIFDVNLGNFVADGGSNAANATVLNSWVLFTGENAVTIEGGTFLKAYPDPNAYIQVNPDAALAKWVQKPNATFYVDTTITPIVEFGVQGYTSGRTFEIRGNTTWYDLVCKEPAATLKFSNYPDLHSVAGGFLVIPLNLAGDALEGGGGGATNPYMILLTRLDDSTGLTPFSPNTQPPSSVTPHFWHFELQNKAQLELSYVYIQYSWAKNRIPLPREGDKVILATPYVNMEGGTANYDLATPRTDDATFSNSKLKSYYNHNWLVANYFFYSFTEDTDGNGRIDRIRAQAAFDLSWEAGIFRASVAGYTINEGEGDGGYTVGTMAKNDADCLYIYLNEQDYSDTGARPSWRIEENTRLKDLATTSILIGSPEHGVMTAWDTAPPRINYALTLPEHAQIYVQFSEPVERDDITVTNPLSSSIPLPDLGNGEIFIEIPSPYAVDDLAVLSPPTFTLENVRDRAAYVSDIRSQPSSAGNLYPYLYPSPKYPVDWTYNSYVEVTGNGLSAGPVSAPFETIPSGGPLPGYIKDWTTQSTPTDQKPGNRLNNGGNGLYPPYGEDTHRVTDALVSVPPTSATDNQFFVWPIWARYTDAPNSGGFPADGTPLGAAGPQGTDTGIIWDFTGKKALEERNVTLQTLRNIVLTDDPELVYAFNVPRDYRNPPEYNTSAQGSSGLWLPAPSSPPGPNFFNLVPRYYSSPYAKTHSSVAVVAASRYYIFLFGKDDPGYDSPSRLDFLFRLSSAAPDLFAARLDIAPGAGIPGDWYRRVRPFSYDIHDLSLQRGGVTILNNVINPENGESVYIRYHLVNSGRVTVQVFTLDGTLIKTLRRENRGAGEWTESWNGTNNGGRPVARGMYFVRVVAPDIDEIRKVMVIK
jgi:hypothetical protein